jgi:Ca2+/Na+ antiporter
MFEIKVFKNILQFEDLPMLLSSLLGMALLLASFVVIGGLDWYFVVGMIAYFAAIYVLMGYLQARSRHRIDRRPDERTARNSTRAARNAFLFALVAVGAAALVSALMYVAGKDPRLVLTVYLMLAALLVLAYSLSYAYYTDRDLT